MRNTYDPRRILPIVLMLTLLAGIAACSHTPQSAIDAMDRAESLIEEHPDSALAIMQTIDSSLLHGRADKARRALLMTMAVDKNYIDTTDFSILQPAIDYYEKHGTPDQRLRTRYYEGRIWMNRGDDDKAMNSFLHASEDTILCTDSLTLSRLFIIQGTLYFRKYQILHFINCNQKAAQIFTSKGNEYKEFECFLNILHGYTLSEDTIQSRIYGHKCDSLLIKYPEMAGIAMPLLIIYHFSFDSPEALRKTLLEYEQRYIADLNPEAKLDMALSYDHLGEYSKALDYVLAAANDINGCTISQDDSIKYNSISSEIFEHNGMNEESLKSYKEYVDNIISQHNYLFNSGVLLTNDKYVYEVAAIQDKNNTLKTSLAFLILILICCLVILIILYTTHIIRTKKRMAESEKREINLKYSNLVSDHRQLELEKENAVLEKENTRLAYENAEHEKDRLIHVAELLKTKIETIESEKAYLQDILDVERSLGSDVRRLIKGRIEMLDGFIKSKITGDKNYEKQLLELEKFIKKDHTKFFSFLRQSFRQSHPLMMERCWKAQLTDRETDYVCLLALGLRSKEIGTYFDMGRINVFASQIRNKLNIPANDSTLSRHIKKFMEAETKS